ncbi:MAG TPA: PAS domain S-box protein [Holophagaceae bacterium]
MTSTETRLSPEAYALLVEQAPIMIWRAGTDGLCDYFNQRWLDFTGRPLSRELGNGWAEGVHPEDLARCLEIYQDHFHRRAVFEMEYRLRREDGAWRWIFDRGVPVFSPGGAFAGFVGSCIDVTERVEAQEALTRAQEAQIHALQGLLPICMTCKKIRNDQGEWEALEKYLHEHSEATLSHGFCPECGALYRERLRAELIPPGKR